jgi:tryptophanyl-tRNA synthetase
MMITDPAKIRKNDPGHPEICNVFAFYKVFDQKDNVAELKEICEKGLIGCVECKKKLASIIIDKMEPIHQKRHELEQNPSIIDNILDIGAKRARIVAERTLEEAREAMKI